MLSVAFFAAGRIVAKTTETMHRQKRGLKAHTIYTGDCWSGMTLKS